MKTNKLLTNFLIISVLLTIGFGCKYINSVSGGISESSDPKETVTSAYKKFMDAKFYHSVTKTQNSQAEIVTETAFSSPDRFWIKNNMPNYKSEVIAIGKDSYNSLNGGKWSKMPAEQSLPVESMRGKMPEEAFAAMKDFVFVGKENLNGKDTLVYTFKNSYGGESSSKMWIAADSGLPLRVDTDGNFSRTNIKTSITYDYDKEVKIEAPLAN